MKRGSNLFHYSIIALLVVLIALQFWSPQFGPRPPKYGWDISNPDIDSETGGGGSGGGSYSSNSLSDCEWKRNYIGTFDPGDNFNTKFTCHNQEVLINGDCSIVSAIGGGCSGYLDPDVDCFFTPNVNIEVTYSNEEYWFYAGNADNPSSDGWHCKGRIEDTSYDNTGYYVRNSILCCSP